jgi:hypothetical protein
LPLLLAAPLSAGALSGCGLAAPYDAGPDAGPVDAPVVARRTLVAEGPSAVTLAPLAETTLRVRVLDEATGRPVADAPLTFAIQGAPRGSTLRQLDGVTDGDGRGTVVLLAGPLATTFRVRILTEGAAPLSFDVSVGTEFGELVVTVEPGTRRSVTSYVVRAAADLPCAEVPMAPGGDERTLGTELTSTSFPALSTAAVWSVDVRGTNGAGLVVARGCVEGLRVTPSEPTTVAVPVRDLPLERDGGYTVALSLAAGGAASDARAAVLAPLAGPPARALLDALAAELALRGSTELGVLEGARSGGLNSRLDARLETGGLGWAGEVEAIAAELDAGFATLVIEGAFVQRETVRLDAARAIAGEATVSGPFTTRVAEVSAVPGLDEQVVRGVELELGAGSLWLHALEGLAAARHPAGWPGLLEDGPTCDAFGELVRTEAPLASCDDACVRAACRRAAEELRPAIDAAAREVDATRSVLRFDATLALTDEDQDLRPDRMGAAGVEARWESTDGSASLPVTLGWTSVRDDTLE